MNKYASKLITFAFVACVSLFLVACGGGSSGSSAPPPPPPPAEEPPPPDTDGDGVIDDEDNFPEDANADQIDSDANGKGDACDPMPLVYSAKGYAGDGTDDGVSYTGQTARQVLQLKLVDYMESIVESPGEFDTISAGMRFYMTGDGADETAHDFSTKGDDPVIPGPTYGDISTGKNLNGKIAGGNLAGSGETGKLIDGEFFGWETGLDSTPLPIELVYSWMDALALEATDGDDPLISVADGTQVNIGSPMISASGIHYR